MTVPTFITSSDHPSELLPLFSKEDIESNLSKHPRLPEYIASKHQQETNGEQVPKVTSVEILKTMPTATQAVFKLKIHYELAGKENSLDAYAKYASYDPFLASIQDNTNEFFAYKVLQKHDPNVIPEVIIAEFNEEKKQFFFLMEDLSEKGFHTLDFGGTDIEIIRAIIRKLASMHAQFYGTEEELEHGNLWKQNFISKQKAFRKKFEGVRENQYPEHSFLSPEQKQIVDWTSKYFSVIFDEKLKRWPSTICHTDVQFGNVLYNKETKDIRIIDWPNMSFRSLLSDLAYYLCWNVDVDLLTKEEDNFLRLYQTEFMESMKTLGKTIPEEVKSFDTVKLMYIINMLELPVMLPLFFEESFDSLDEGMRTFFQKMFGRIFHNAIRHEAVKKARSWLKEGGIDAEE